MKNELDSVSSTCITEGNIEGISVVLFISNKQYQVISIYCHPSGKTSEICAAVEKLSKHIPDAVTKCHELYNFLEQNMNAKPALCEETTDNHTSLDHIYTAASFYKIGILEC